MTTGITNRLLKLWGMSGQSDRLPSNPQLLIIANASGIAERYVDLRAIVREQFQDVIGIQLTVTWKMAFPTYAWVYFPVGRAVLASDRQSPAEMASATGDYWVSYGGPSMSGRGEYRKGFTRLDPGGDKNWQKLYPEAYEHFFAHLQAGTIGFYQRIYYPTWLGPRAQRQFENILEEKHSELAMVLYIYSWLEGYFHIEENSAPSNMSWDYRAVMHHPADKELYWNIVEDLAAQHYIPVSTPLLPGAASDDKRKYKNLRAMKQQELSVFGDDPRVYPLQLSLAYQFRPTLLTSWGQKMIPLTKNELAERGNIAHAPWKEGLVEALLSSNALNMVGPALLSPGYFIIAGGMGSFDSTSIRDRYVHDDTGQHIHQLASQDGGITVNVTDDPGKLAAVLRDAVGLDIDPNDPQGPKRLSDHVLVRICETAFATLPDLLDRIVEGCVSDIFKALLQVEGYPVVRGLVFDYLWQIYTMARRNKVVHSRINVDHLAVKKVTYPLRGIYAGRISPNLVVLRMTPDKIYQIPRAGFTGVFLSCGRGFVLNSEEIGKSFLDESVDTPGSRANLFLSAETRKARAVIEAELAATGSSYVIPAETSPEALVEMLALIDMCKLSSCLAGYLEASVVEAAYSIPPKSIDFIKSIGATAALELQKCAADISSAGLMKHLEAVLDAGYADWIMDPACMSAEPDVQCIVSEVYSVVSEHDWDARTLTLEEFRAAIEKGKFANTM